MASKARLKRVMKTIEQNPKHWKQSDWHCGTSHCFAGFAILDKYKQLPSCSDKKIYSITQCNIPDEATEYLKITSDEADTLFCGVNSLEDLQRMVSNLIKGKNIATGLDYLDDEDYDCVDED